jgi:hypothetical protein
MASCCWLTLALTQVIGGGGGDLFCFIFHFSFLLYFQVIGWIAWIRAGLTAFYMFHIYFITLEGNFRANSFTEIFLVLAVTTSKEFDRKGLSHYLQTAEKI